MIKNDSIVDEYYYLIEGDIIMDGDEWLNAHENKWIPTGRSGETFEYYKHPGGRHFEHRRKRIPGMVIPKAGNNNAKPILDSGERRAFSTGSVRDVREGKGRFDLMPWDALERLSQHFEAGCAKYGDRNWERGQNLNSYFDSATRHLQKWHRRQDDEDHLVAACWNTLAALATALRIKRGLLPAELDDRP